MQHKDLDRVHNLLRQALSVALHSMPDNRSIAEAKRHMRQAMTKIEVVQQKQQKKKHMTQNQFESWWGNVQAGTSQVAASPMSSEAQQKSLAQLDAMIEREKQKLKELEKQADARPVPDQLLGE